MRKIIFIGLFIISIPHYVIASGNSCIEDPKDSDLICFNGTLQNPCDTGSGYGSMVCSKNSLKKADIELNELYKKVIAKIEPDSQERKPKTSFIAAQKKWIEWRDAICLYEQESNSGSGAWQATARNTCLTKITEAKSRAFKQYISCFELGGDECNLQHSISAP